MGLLLRPIQRRKTNQGAFGRREGGKTHRASRLPIRHFSRWQAGSFCHLCVSQRAKKQLALVPVDSPQNTKILDLQHPVHGPVRFTHDGKAVVYTFHDQEAENLWLQPLDGSPGKQITNFKSEQIKDFHWSFDGSKLGMVRGHTDSDVVLLEESKP